MKLPRDVSGSDAVKALKRLGFTVVKQEGSHIRMSKGACRVTIPNHKSIVPKTLQSLLRQASVSIEEGVFNRAKLPLSKAVRIETTASVVLLFQRIARRFNSIANAGNRSHGSAPSVTRWIGCGSTNRSMIVRALRSTPAARFSPMAALKFSASFKKPD
ncbi:MAG TPA: type II toxin-antitoxin system HicA family toxin [Chthoniobacteraceae bacterium]|nr:type II toxin-antitoxin system HicA family toxin [Chthoniobacteraceae bacterium]